MEGGSARSGQARREECKEWERRKEAENQKIQRIVKEEEEEEE